jgi:hypothetical protein
MTETPCHGHKNANSNESNDFHPLAPIMVSRNDAIRWCQGPSQISSQHRITAVSIVVAEEDKENERNVAATSQKGLISTINTLVTV